MKLPHPRHLTLTASAGLALFLLGGFLLVPIPPASAAPTAALQGSGILDTILNVARDARNAARDGADSAREIRNRVRNGAEGLTNELLDTITDVAGDLGRQISIQVEGRDEFLSGDVEQFRQDVIDLLTGMQEIMNAIQNFGEPCPVVTPDPVDFARLIDIVEGLPDKLLFFLYRALSVSLDFDRPCGLVAQILEIQEDLGVVAQVLGEPIPAGPFQFDFERSSCDFMLQFPGLVRRATFRLRASALGMKAAATMMEVLGKVGISGTAQIHGYIGGDFEVDMGEKAGDLFQGLSDMLSKVEGACSEKMRHCALVGGMLEIEAAAPTLEAQLAIQENQAVILENQRTLLASQGEIKALLEELLK